MIGGAVVDAPVGANPHGCERDGSLELPASAGATGRGRVRVRPVLLDVRDDGTATATGAVAFGSALDAVAEHADHAPAAHAEGDHLRSA
ncbi:hypothetical protein [Streptomyces sp. MI02-7b]|uniref:hypothetical protein n=1 Tax=Streptomyces sp. MI02-7b TaxID=462941 RepID=UPI0029CA7D04|nr:hypothetical protein [Streptomyces sp. MI02-7b]